MQAPVLTYVIHVRTAHARKAHIERQLAGKPLDVCYILEGDVPDLTHEAVAPYFKDDMLEPLSPRTSCAYKHLRAYQRLLETDAPYCLVFEDDIILEPNFIPELAAIREEIARRELAGFLISIEDSTLRYVPGSQRQKGQHLYKATFGRTAGAYLIDRKAAGGLIAHLLTHPTDLQMDWFHNICADAGVLQIYWSHPTLAVQGSHTGSARSSLDGKAFGWLRVASFHLQRSYKRLLYRLR
ncbi:MAG: glycosyltransferase family 25 protein [Bacteroidetes bacterium]|nr:glycosyltransferase family 25 protein [Bacteroidota bacterium]